MSVVFNSFLLVPLLQIQNSTGPLSFFVLADKSNLSCDTGSRKHRYNIPAVAFWLADDRWNS